MRMKKSYPTILFVLSLVLLAACSARVDSTLVRQIRHQAESGDADSQYKLGLRYTNGYGVDQHYGTGAEWFARAADQDHAAAQYMLGIAYYTGRGVGQDHHVGVEWFQRAADQGHARAQYQLGDAFANGRGVTREPAWAARWFGQAALGGHAEAQFALGVAFAAGMGLPVDTVEAARWLAKAGAGGHREAVKVHRAVVSGMTPEEAAKAERLAGAPSGPDDADAVDGPVIRFVRFALSRSGYVTGDADGTELSGSAPAIRSYRRKAGLPEGGEITPDLLTHLRAGLLDK